MPWEHEEGAEGGGDGKEPLWQYGVKIALLFLLYFASARFGLQFEPIGGFATLFWPPTGIALAVLFLFGSRLWPAVLAAAFLANYLNGAAIPVAIALGAGNALEALIGASLLHMVGFRPQMRRMQDVVCLVVFAAFGSTVLSATIGTTALWVSATISFYGYFHTWIAWWGGDAISDMIIAPFIFTTYSYLRSRPALPGIERALELAVLLLIFYLSLQIAFGEFRNAVGRSPAIWLVFIPIVWGALRFGPHVSSLMLVALFPIVAISTAGMNGPFQGDTLAIGLAYAQFFLAVLSVTSMVLCAVESERRSSAAGLLLMNEELEKRVEERTKRLALSEAMLQDTQRRALIGGWELELATDKVRWDKGLYHIFGIDPGVEMTRDWSEKYVHPEDRKIMDEEVGRCLRSGKPFSFECRLLIDGRIKWLQNTGEVILGTDGTPLLLRGTAQDITGRKLSEELAEKVTEEKARAESAEAQKEESDRINEELKALDRIKDEFLMLTSHELKTPLTPTIIQSQMLLGGHFGALNGEQEESIRLILRNTKNLNRLVNDILDLSLIREKGLKLRMMDADIGGIINEAALNLSPLARDKGITMLTSSSGMGEVRCDPARVNQVVTNLIDNAIKFTPREGRITIDALRKGGEMVVRVSDSGIGISEENLEKLFSPFYQVNPAYKHRSKGVGLGLAICKGIVEAHGGRIWAESGLGAGTTFFFSLPLGRGINNFQRD